MALPTGPGSQDGGQPSATLSRLAFARSVFVWWGGGDGAYRDLPKATGFAPGMSGIGHRRALLTWLNKWGFRQIAIDYHHLACEAYSLHGQEEGQGDVGKLYSILLETRADPLQMEPRL